MAIPNKTLSHLAYAATGLLAGAWLANDAASDRKLSRAEKEAPDDVEEATREIAALLEEWGPPTEYANEDEVVDDLYAYLEQRSEWEIELRPSTPAGVPDILVGDVLAIEVKVSPGKNERNRLIGQCADYARLWATWAVLVDSPASKVGHLEGLLIDSGLEQIAVWSF